MTTICFLGLNFTKSWAQQPANPRFSKTKTGDFNCENTGKTISITEVGFRGDHIITEWDGDEDLFNDKVIDSPDGTVPIWTNNGTNKPVCYTKGSIPTAFLKLESIEDLDGMYDIRVKNNSKIFGIKNQVLPTTSTTIEVVAFTFSEVLSDEVMVTSAFLQWEIKASSSNAWMPAGNTTIKFFWTNATPLSSTFNDAFFDIEYPPLYDFALEKACNYVNGSKEYRQKITEGIANDIFYEPSSSLPGGAHPLLAYSLPAGCLCADFANLLRGLFRTIGIDGTVIYIWGGRPNTQITYNIGSTCSLGGLSCLKSTFRTFQPKNDGAEFHPHFLYHAVVESNGLLYDSSYGTSYLKLRFTETAKIGTTNTMQQSATTFPEFKSTSFWTCPH